MLSDIPIPKMTEACIVEYTIKANKEVLPSSLEVKGITISKAINRLPSASIVVLDGNPATQTFEESNKNWCVPGTEIEISVGDLEEEIPVFKGVIISQSINIRKGTSYLEVSCRDVAYQMSLRRKSRYFTKGTDSAIATEILEEYSLLGEVTDTPYEHAQLVQYETSDWDFLIMRMDFNGLFIHVDNGKINIAPPDFKQDPALELEYGKSILELEGTLEVRDQFSTVISRSWNTTNQELLEITAKEPSIKINGQDEGSDLANANGEQVDIHRHGGRILEGELQAWADARLLKDRLSRSRGRVQFRGLNNLKPGEILQLKGVGSRFDGPVYVSGVRHEIHEGLWLTDVEFGLSPKWFAQEMTVTPPPAAGMLAPVCGLQIGVVTQIEEDPEHEHRVQVRLPIVSAEAAGTWARLATFDAGPERGSFFLPEPGDEVIVGFVNDDPRNAVVLGSLHSSQRATPFLAVKENKEKGYVSREGIRWVMDEEKKAITLATPGGNQILLSDGDEGILLSDQHGNSIRMNGDGISINSVKKIQVESTLDCQVKAGGNWNAAGKQLNLKASGSLSIKGSKIDLN